MPQPPTAIAVEVIVTAPTDADSAAIAHLSATGGKALPKVAYLVKIRLKTMPEPTSQGWALYVKDFRIPKYWEAKDGIYFKVFDPQFFEDHKGERLRFSQNGTEFVDTKLRLAAPRRHGGGKLPRQEEVLK